MDPQRPVVSLRGVVNLNVGRFEITPVYTHPDATVDIILVHGLNGQPKKTWTANNNLYWPAELLPETLKEHPANVLVYGYNADVFGRKSDASPSKDFIYQHAMTLVTTLTAHRQSRGTSGNPIIWIAHSLGGILVKRALLYSNDLRDAEHEAARSVYVSTYGIIFLGTPHTGSGLAFWGRFFQSLSAVAPKKFFDSESVLINSLKQNNELLQEINNHFLDVYQRFRIQMVHENHKTDLKGTKAFVVDVNSASPPLPGVTYYGIEADHSNMCKFDGPTAPGYQTMTTAIQEWVQEAPAVIEVRWRVEQEDIEARARRDLDERRMTYANLRSRNKAGTAGGKGSVGATSITSTGETSYMPIPPGGFVESPTSVTDVPDAVTSPLPLMPPPVSTAASDASTVKPDPLFLHPEKFRPNSYFFGRKRELEDLHRRLTDSKRRAEGTSAVVIQSLPGGGKTHLARQYVFQHRADYPGGIYWVRAKSISEMEEFFWSIAKNGALRNVVEKTLGDEPAAPGTPGGSQKALCDPHNVVNIVRAWFSGFEQWLLVFDGIIFNTPNIERFIPDAKNTSIIYTSIQSNVTGRYEFDNPQIMKLGMLSPIEARDLLLTEMERGKSWKEDDKAQSLEIVKRIGCLPLMVHAAARHIKATQEPLPKYLRTLQTRIWAGDLPAYQGVWEELKSRGAYPALNLMYILAFFGGRVPVGFLNLGLGALDKKTPVLTRDATHRNRSLNNSLRTLIAFALIERSEAGSISPSSSQHDSKRSNGSQNSSKHSQEKTHESVDLLLIHTVVQRFFVDVLTDIKQASFWLECSAQVFCRAFDKAIEVNDNHPGLLDDYRCFKTHGEKVLEHLSYLLKKSPLLFDLSAVKDKVQTRLLACEQAIMTLSEATQSFIVNETDAPAGSHDNLFSVESVFERASSFSDLSTSNSTSQSSQASATNSAISSRTDTGFDDERAGVHIIDTDTAMNMDIDTPTDLDTEMQFDEAAEVPSVDKGKEPMHQIWTNPQIANTSGGTLFQSPDVVYSPVFPGGHNPYFWHVPYPTTQDTMPAPPSPEDDDKTEGAMSEAPTPQISVASPAGAGPQRTESLGAFGLRHPSSTVPNHRVIQRNNERRYHDRAGAWRAKDAHDPRRVVPGSVSCEPAEGFVIMPQPQADAVDPRHSGTALSTIGSAAKLSLNKFRTSANQLSAIYAKVMPSTGKDGERDHQRRGRAQSAASVGVRPLSELQQNTQGQGAMPVNQNVTSGEPFPSFDSPSSNPSEEVAHSSSPSLNNTLKWMAKYLRSHEQQPKTENSAAYNAANMQPTPEVDSALTSSIETLLQAQIEPVHRGTRTANSTPTRGHGPFQPPPGQHPASQYYYTQPATFDGDDDGTRGYGSTQYDLPSAIPRWESDVYHPGAERLSSTDLGFGISDQDRMTASYPPMDHVARPGPASLPQQPPSHFPPGFPPPAHLLQQRLFPARNVDGYSSQPMSRNTSAQSQPPAHVQGFPPGHASSVQPFAGGHPGHAEERQPQSHSLPQSFDGNAFDRRRGPFSAQQLPSLRRNSRSSLVQTEPSPQLDNPLADINTSYRQWERTVHPDQQGYSERLLIYEVEMRRSLPGPRPRPHDPHIMAQSSGSGSGSRSGSRSGSAGGVDRERSGSTVMSRSQSDQGPGVVPAASEWVPVNVPFPPMGPPAAGRAAPYPTHFANIGEGDGHTSQPMSRTTSNTSRGSDQAMGWKANAAIPQDFETSRRGPR